MKLLNGCPGASISCPEVTSFRYEHVRPFHPGRLNEVLMSHFGAVDDSDTLNASAAQADMNDQATNGTDANGAEANTADPAPQDATAQGSDRGDVQHGNVIRSVGFCTLATRPGITLQWDQVGQTIAFHATSTLDGACKDHETLTVGQDIAFLGMNLDTAKLRNALDGAALTDAELVAGPYAWLTFPDPFPAYHPEHDEERS